MRFASDPIRLPGSAARGSLRLERDRGDRPDVENPGVRRQPDRRVRAAARTELSRRSSKRGCAPTGIDAQVINAGVSGDTTAGGLARLDWALADKPDLVILELGANDMLRGIDPATVRANLDKMIGKIKASGAKLLLAGMQAPPNWGEEYEERIRPHLSRACAGARGGALSVFSRRCGDEAGTQPAGRPPPERARRGRASSTASRLMSPAARRRVMSAPFRRRLRRGRSRDPRRAAVAAQLPQTEQAPRSASSMSASRPRRPCRNSSASWPTATGIAAWVGGVGLGVCAAGEEVYDRPAAAVLTRGPAARQLPPVRRDRRSGRRSAAPACRLDRDRRSRRWRWSTAIRAAPICCGRRSIPPRRAAPFWSAG